MLGSSIAWLSCSCAPFSRHPLEATVRDGVLQKRFVVCPDRAVLLLPAFTDGHCWGTFFLHKETVSPPACSVFYVQFCFALLVFYNIVSCPISFKDRRNNQCCVFVDQ